MKYPSFLLSALMLLGLSPHVGANLNTANTDKSEDCDCPTECPTEPGMATYSYSRFLASFYVSDTPIALETPFGPSMNVTFTFAEDAKHDLGSLFSDVGSGWFSNWFSYVDEVSSTERIYYLPDGRRETHTGSGATFVRNTLSLTESEKDGSTFYRHNPDGSKLIYGHSSNGTPNRYFLSAIEDSQGNEVTIHYDTGPSGNGDRVTEVRDAFGRKLVFLYGNSDYRVTGVKEVVDSVDKRSIALAYDGNDLASITDVVGIVSSFEYDGSEMTAMTTPYGTTSFEDRSFDIEVDVNTTLNFKCIEITDPMGLKETILYGPEFSDTLFSNLNASSPLFSSGRVTDDIENSDIGSGSKTYYNSTYGMTLFWDKKANKYYPPDLEDGSNFDKARATYWYVDSQGKSHPHMMAVKSPLTARKFAVYPNNAGGNKNVDPLEDPQEGWATKVEDEEGDPAVHWSEVYFNAEGNVIQTVDPMGQLIDFEYASNGIDLEDVYVEDLLDGPYQIAKYSGHGSGPGHLPTSLYDATNAKTTLVYNSKGQVTKVTNELGEEFEFTYGWPDGFEDPTTGGSAENDGFLESISVTDPVSGNGITDVEVLSITYHDDTGYVESVADSLTGLTTTYNTYDALGRLTKVTHPDTSTEEFYFERDGVKYLDVVRHLNREGKNTHYEYNGNKQLVSVIDPEMRNTRIEWCSCGHIEALTDALGRHTEWERDLHGRVTRKILPDEEEISYTYEALSGRLSTITNPNEQGGSNVSVEFKYFIDGKIAEKVYPGESNPFFAKFTYDAILGRIESAKWYDEGGALQVNDYEYYDLLYSLGGTGVTAGAGMLHTIDGPWVDDSVVYEYDDLGRRIGADIADDDSPWGSPTFESSITSIDALGRVKQHANDLGAFTTTYTGTDTRPDDISSGNFEVAFDYLSSSSGGYLSEIHATYNNSTISKFNYTYTADGKIDTWTKTQGTVEFMNFVYDLAGQLKKATTRQSSSSGTVLQTLSFGYDRAGNRTSRTEDEDPYTANFNDRNQLTTGDFLGEVPFIGEMNEWAEVEITVDSVTKPARVREYGSKWIFEAEVELDSSGETEVEVGATDASDNTTVESYQIDSGSGEWADLEYDDNGNTTSREVNGVTITYTWDRENRLETVTKSGVTDRFVYNAIGERVKIIEDDGGAGEDERLFIWTGGYQPSQERSSSNVVVGNFHYEGEQRLLGGSLYDFYYARDHLGSVREVVNDTGSVEARYDYTPFGVRETIGGASVDATFGFTGHFYHELSGHSLTYFRAYAPDFGRWLSPDSLEAVTGEMAEMLPEGPNLYGYGGNRPVSVIDPDGQFIFTAIGLGIAAAVTIFTVEEMHECHLDAQEARASAAARNRLIELGYTDWAEREDGRSKDKAGEACDHAVEAAATAPGTSIKPPPSPQPKFKSPPGLPGKGYKGPVESKSAPTVLDGAQMKKPVVYD